MRFLGAAALLGFLPAVADAQQSGWGNAAKPVEKGFSWTAPLWPSFWMAWTPATLAVFVGLFAAMGILTFLEIRHPGGDERKGALGLVTTRGDRLFITLLGSCYIFMAWLWLVGMPLWWPLALSVGWGIFCFRKV